MKGELDPAVQSSKALDYQEERTRESYSSISDPSLSLRA